MSADLSISMYKTGLTRRFYKVSQHTPGQIDNAWKEQNENYFRLIFLFSIKEMSLFNDHNRLNQTLIDHSHIKRF